MLTRYKQKFKELRKKMKVENVSAKDIASVINRNPAYIYSCLNGQSEFRIDEAYKILEFLGEQETQIIKYFPRNGVSVKEEWTDEQNTAYLETLHAFKKLFEVKGG